MTGLELFAFFILPMIVVLIGWIAVLLHERSLKVANHNESHKP